MEQAWIERARAGDAEAFARLATAHREAVYRAAYAVLRDPHDALDATQEAFLRAFRFMDRFEGRSSFKTWARTIATRVALDRVARTKRRGRMSALPAEDVVPDDDAPSPEQRVERDERRRLVRAAIDALPPAQRAAVVLRDVEGLSYAEIAEALEIPKGTVMSRLHAGRQNLKRALAPVLGAEEVS